MQFFEQLFGLSPDGGNGSLEVCLMLLPFVLALVTVEWMYKTKYISDCDRRLRDLFAARHRFVAADLDVRRSQR
jgi:hypothetical protein